MADTLDPKHLDKRTAERYLRSGQLSEDAYARHIKDLPDVADKSVAVVTAMDGEEFFDDEDDDLEDDGVETVAAAAATEAADEEDADEEDADEDDADEEDADEEDEAAAKDTTEDTETP
ncbi:RNA polymerase subunit sigma [Stigmatella sp. ncwal1]|uniref:RNA polymerase subunit sigma n=1 Tax=Stigmatella ashevillensis TaxID=2995309 RepID=A0ABT5D8U0_9BACT|nr:RNA polymerase subunit sigma [Stigmatella ashevillena]MDC0709248.1 RNA polymerase subunit sigma [Stigmatella ashevillena]